MSFVSKFELKKYLKDLGIRVEGNHIKKSDIEQIVGEAAKLKGKVKWFRHDGDGYIEAGGKSYPFHVSSIKDSLIKASGYKYGAEVTDKILSKYARGTSVTFTLTNLMGRDVATEIELA